MSASLPTRPMYLQGSGTPFFAVLHAAAGTSRQTAVLLCPPFGWEDMCTYRIRREWAAQLAQAGHTTLRLDLPGSGDSAGAPGDPGQLDAWTRAVEDAARWLAQCDGIERVAAIGIGLGGIVTCRAALGGAAIDELVLWSVPTRGHTIVRELRAFSALEVANMVRDGWFAGSDDPEEAGSVVANGYLLSAATVAELERLDLREIEPSSQTLRRVLLLGRDGLKIDKTLPAVLEHAGAEVTVANGPGYGAMMPAEPLDARVPMEVIERVGSWLAQGPPARASSATAPARRRGAAERPGADEPGDREEISLERSGVALRERPVVFEGPGGRLFGVLSEPLGERRELTGVLLNAGFQRRTGPNRMWVEIARRWAASGVATLRLDAAGIGDFDGDAPAPERITDFYKPLYVEHARAALAMLVERGLPPRFAMVGFCSGAYCSAQAALADERVAAVLMLNPRTLIFDEWQWRHTVRHMRHVRERMLFPSTWGKVLRGEIGLDKHLETGRTLVQRAASAPLRARRRIAPARRGEEARREPIEGLFDALRDRGQRVTLMFTGKEVLHDELRQRGVLDRLDRWPNLELALLETAVDTHTLTPLWVQRQVHALVARVLDDELARLADA